VAILFLTNIADLGAQKDKLIYVGDPMCSWCYGFTGPLQEIKEKFPQLEFMMVMGGLRAGGEESLSSLKSFLYEHWNDVNAKTGQIFNFEILDNSTMIYNTEPACRAVVSIRNIIPEKEYLFFQALQKSFYVEGKDPTQIENLVAVAASIGVDKSSFINIFQNLETRTLTEKDFLLSEQMGINGFPSLILYKEGKYYRISNGYNTTEQIIKKFESFQIKPKSDYKNIR
jgi:putative protein-disulfide isomerase